MEFSSLEPILREYGPYWGTLVMGFLSGFVPIFNIEIYLFWIVAQLGLGPEMIWPVALVASVGQVLSKVLIYLSCAGALRIRFSKKITPEKIEAVSKKLLLGGWRSDLMMALSASVGFPPFMVTNVVAGLGGYSLLRFTVIGLLGRFLRFYAIARFPEVF